MTSNRALAETWAYPRHRDFEEHLREAATTWFASKGFAVNSRQPYILDQWEHWPHNIIVPQVAEYVEEERVRRHDEHRGFPLHQYLHHGLSSQAMLLNLVGPLIVARDLSPLRQAFEELGIACPKGTFQASFEMEDRRVFNEDSGQPTSFDLVLNGGLGSPVFVEAKLVEREFGGCSVFEAGDCDGRNPAGDFLRCYLHHLGRQYWVLLERHGFLSGPIGQGPTCILTNYYQFFREVTWALEKGGTFVLLHDPRNPTFQCDGPHGPRGLMPFLVSLMPASARARVATVTVQQVLAAIRASNRHDDWVGEFERKYALV